MCHIFKKGDLINTFEEWIFHFPLFSLFLIRLAYFLLINLSLFLSVAFLSKIKRTGSRRRYHDDGISDEEIDGRRMFDLEDKVHSERFSSDRVVRMEGKGTNQVLLGLFKEKTTFSTPHHLYYWTCRTGKLFPLGREAKTSCWTPMFFEKNTVDTCHCRYTLSRMNVSSSPPMDCSCLNISNETGNKAYFSPLVSGSPHKSCYRTAESAIVMQWLCFNDYPFNPFTIHRLLG